MIPLRPVLILAMLSMAMAPGASADTLQAVFSALPQGERVALQSELARADLFLAEVDGHWSPLTERALLRSVEAVAQKTGDRVHPRLSDPGEVLRFLHALEEGSFSTLLYGGSFWERLFLPLEAPPDWSG